MARHENRLELMLQQLTYHRLLILYELEYLSLSRKEASLPFGCSCNALRAWEFDRHQ
ncbi:MAG: hypothetical protein U0236_00990 [Nitrospira sp.]